MRETSKLKPIDTEASSFWEARKLAMSVTRSYIGGGVPAPGLKGQGKLPTFYRPAPPWHSGGGRRFLPQIIEKRTKPPSDLKGRTPLQCALRHNLPLAPPPLRERSGVVDRGLIPSHAAREVPCLLAGVP